MLKIKDKNTLIKVFKAISWLDSKRWDNEENCINFSKENLTNCEKILTHWICYVTDRQMPFEIVWDKGGYVFSEVIYEYSRDNYLPKQILENHYDKFKDKKGVERFRFKSTDNEYFASICY